MDIIKQALPKWMWSDLKIGEPFEITIVDYPMGEITYFKGETYYRFKAEMDMGVDEIDMRKCRFTLPEHQFIQAFLAWPVSDRKKFITKKMKITIVKKGWKSMIITSMEEVK